MSLPRHPVLMIIILMAMVAASGARAEGAAEEVRYRLAVDGGGLGYVIDETVLFIRVTPSGAAKPFWVVERHLKEVQPGLRPQPADSHQWIDGRACAAMAGVLRELARLPPLIMAAPDGPSGSLPPSDVPRTRLAGPAARQDKEWAGVEVVRSEYFGPAARWWNRSRISLRGCWRDEPVATPDGQVRAHLNSPEQVRWMKP